MSGPSGALVISLDFELKWGIRHSPSGSRERLLGARAAVVRMLELFREYDVAATWATVGFLFARDRKEKERFSPAVRPGYHDARLSPFDDPVGETEESDPAHYAASLVERIRDTERQEVATHTFSHYLCGEPGQDAASFAADLAAACAIAAERGVTLRSIVFPRNQHNPEYDHILLAHGITACRGNPRTWMWRFRNGAESDGRARRAARLLDAYLSLDGHNTVGWDEVLQPSGLADVRASQPLRPYSPRLRSLEPLRVRRLRGSVRAAARTSRIFHLWWHPHNFGLHQEENLRVLRAVLDEYRACRERYGMRSLSMAEAASEARGLLPTAPVSLEAAHV